MIPIFYINLVARADRRWFMERQIAELELIAQCVPAISPAEIETELTRAPAPGPISSSLASSEICVTLSHRRVWRRIVEERLACALVLEDDAVLSPRIPRALAQIEQVIAQWCLVRLETGARKVKVGPPVERLADVSLARAHSAQWGTAGYVISKAGARLLLDAQNLFEAPLDHVLFDPNRAEQPFRTWVQATPGLCVQGGQLGQAHPLWESDVASGRRQRRDDRPRVKLSTSEKIGRELARVGRQGAELCADLHARLFKRVGWTVIPFETRPSDAA